MGWFEPWYWDPGSTEPPDDYGGVYPCKEGNDFLSIHYWQTWSKIRPPICVVCPNGRQWEIDRKSSNGTGWTVSGEWPNLTCNPSIVVEGYHGFLQGGRFTASLDGLPPDGVPYVPAERTA